jgi:fatty acid desaturase
MTDDTQYLNLARSIGRQFGNDKVLPIVHNLINVFSLILVFIFILLVLMMADYSQSITWALIFSPLFGLLLFALFILVVHESSHHNLFFAKKFPIAKTIELFLARIVCYLSFQSFDRDWLDGHNRHHTFPLKNEDPQNCPSFCLNGKKLLIECLKVLFLPGYSFYKQSSCHPIPFNKNLMTILISTLLWLMIFSVISLQTNVWVAASFYWGTSWAMVLNLLKVSMEHSGRALLIENEWLKSFSSEFFGQKILMPFSICLHFEHHLMPKIPWYNLASFHRQLKDELPKDFQAKVFHSQIQVAHQILGLKLGKP